MKRRILLVDYDPDALRSLGDFLTKAGYEVLPASNGEDAVQLSGKPFTSKVLL